VKVTVVGGGSSYTPELIDGVGRLRDLAPVRELVLHDPDRGRLETIEGISSRILARQAWPGRFSATDDLARALDGADFVLVQLRVGGQAARQLDETLPLRCGCVGQETTGAGGFAKALRTVPVVLDVADEVRGRASDDAWIIDFTNPVGIVTRALLDHGHRAIGLCNVAIGFERLFAPWLGVEPSEVRLGHAGLNHLTWIQTVDVGGDDVLPMLLRDRGDELADHVGLPRAVVDSLGAVPSYYLRYFYLHDTVVEEQRHRRTRAEEVADLERELFALYRDPSVDEKPALLARRGGAFYSEAALRLVGSLWADRGDVQVVDVRNRGAFPWLPDGAVVELPCRIHRDGAAPVTAPVLALEQRGLVQHVAAYEQLTVDAAVTGDAEVAFRALLAHPLIGQATRAEQLLADLLAANRQHLPRFGL
jgi:6-phospho-beta-glucosidase